ncbi:MAG: hypothetical protein Q8K30_04870 [Candidatus Gracilibacteria bacterium]|nr:hypothetical protein [Candidatus Gracilibacteria bacterium]
MTPEQSKTSADKVIDKIKELNIPEGRDFTDAEKTAIDNLFKEVKTEEGKNQVRDYIQKHLKGDSKNELLSLSKDVGNNVELSKKPTFGEFKEKMGSKNEIMAKLFSISDIYFDLKLKNISLSSSEKENIKLILWDKLLNSINFDDGLGIIVGKISSKINSLSGLLGISKQGENTKEFKPEELINTLSNLEKELSINVQSESGNILFGSFDELIGDSFESIKNAKLQNKQLDSFDKVRELIYHNDSKFKNITIEDIKNNTLDKIKTFDNLKGVGDKVKGLLDTLPSEFVGEINSFLKEISLQYPILGFILSLFLGEGFLDGFESNGKIKKSLSSLLSLVEKSPSNSLINKIKLEDLKKLEPKKLELFYKYLDEKEIDYSSEDFWQSILTGNTKNEQLLRINMLLKDKDGNVLTKDGDINKFVTKLNSIKKLDINNNNQEIAAKNMNINKEIEEKSKKQEELKKQQDLLNQISVEKNTEKKQELINANKEIIETSGLKTSDLSDSTILTKKIQEVKSQNIQIDNDIKEIELKKEKTFEEYLNEGLIKVSDKLEKISIDPKNSLLIIGDKHFKLSIQANIFGLSKEVLESVSFEKGLVIIQANNEKVTYSANESEPILKKLIKNGSYNEKIDGKPANFIINPV